MDWILTGRLRLCHCLDGRYRSQGRPQARHALLRRSTLKCGVGLLWNVSIKARCQRLC